jgi:hypothetical protein
MQVTNSETGLKRGEGRSACMMANLDRMEWTPEYSGWPHEMGKSESPPRTNRKRAPVLSATVA